MPAGQAKLPGQLQEECSQSVADGRTHRERRADRNANARADRNANARADRNAKAKALSARLTVRFLPGQLLRIRMLAALASGSVVLGR